MLALAREGKHAQEQHAQAVLWWIYANQYEHEGRAQHLLSWYGQRFGHTKVISARALLRYVEGERTFMRGDI